MESQHSLTKNSVKVRLIFLSGGALIVNMQFKFMFLYSPGKFGDSIIPPSDVTFLHDPQSTVKNDKNNKYFLKFQDKNLWSHNIIIYLWHCTER